VQVRLSAVLVGFALVAAGCASSKAADTTTRMQQVRELRALERPTVRELKLTFVALTLRHDARGAAELERAADDARAVLEWIDDHASYAQANGPTVGCFDESLNELREGAEEVGPALRDRSLTTHKRLELKRALAEAVNCLQASD
jgi:hypothetical protein